MMLDQAEQVLRQLGSHKFIKTKKGFMTNCPLSGHKRGDKKPSLQVFEGSPTRCKCYSCGFSGKLFFLAKQSGVADQALLDYIDGVEGRDVLKKAKSLPDYDSIPNAVRYGSSRVRAKQLEQAAKDRIFKNDGWFAYGDEVGSDIGECKVDMGEVQRWWKSPLPQYLKGRNITEEVYKAWKLGFDPIGYRNLKERDDKRYWVNFGPRAMFVCIDHHGNVVGWSGRAVLKERDKPKFTKAKDGLNEVVMIGVPKYFHMPGWNKERYLYGMHMVDRRVKTCILVEGPMDAIRVWSYGFKNALALQGAYITEYQTEYIIENFSRVVLLPDGDKPGITCMEKVFDSLKSRIVVKIAGWIDGKDPDDLTRKEMTDMLKTTYKIEKKEN